MFDPLLLSIGVPLAAGLLCLLCPQRWSPARAWFSVAAAAITLVAVCFVFVGGGQTREWAGWSFRVDGLVSFVLLAAASFALLIAVYSLDYMKGQRGQRLYYACLLWTLGLSCGVLLANDLLLLLICWGLLAVTLYLMIGLVGPDGAEAARKSLLIVGGSDAALLLGVVLLWMQQGSTRMDAGALSLDSPMSVAAFLCFTVAAFAKAGVIPFHSWLPDCGEKAHAPWWPICQPHSTNFSASICWCVPPEDCSS